jgi:hypothetical protein
MQPATSTTRLSTNEKVLELVQNLLRKSIAAEQLLRKSGVAVGNRGCCLGVSSSGTFGSACRWNG